MIALPHILALLAGWTLDLLLGDPAWLPHPVVWFGKMISFGEKRLNRGHHRKLKGGIMAITLITFVFAATYVLIYACESVSFAFGNTSAWYLSPLGEHGGGFSTILTTILSAILIFYCLAGTTLVREVRDVFRAVDRSLDEGRKQVARIVGRDTSQLSAQEIRTAALETLAENLSDGVIAPLFWLAVLGVPGMMAYKMVNTLDSMIGYRTERYRQFGCIAARIDDVANYLPARITALFMVAAGGNLRSGIRFVAKYGHRHASPNSGYPEAALASILDVRFGGPHIYFGELIDKPYIGNNDRQLTTPDMQRAILINRMVEVMAIIVCAVSIYVRLKIEN